jgi:signal transduction histidine kinase
MSFYRKTLLALFLTSGFLLIIAVGGAYQALSESVTKNYETRYQSLTTTLAETIEKLESGTEDTMRAALLALRYAVTDRPIPSDDTLRVMERNLRVSSIEFVQRDGAFIRSTHYPLKELPNLFSFCAGYRELFTGESEYDRTPFMPSVVDRKVLKFALLPTLDRRHVINVGMEVKYIGELFRSMMASDKNLLTLGLYTPSGKPLGSLAQAEDGIVEVHEPSALATLAAPATQAGPTSIAITTPVRATVASCCECVGKGLVNDPSGKFHYILKTEVSLGDLKGSIGKIGQTLMFAAGLGLLFAFGLSRAIARRLTRRLEKIDRTTRQLADLKDLSVRFNFTGKDEVSNIAKTLDHLLDSLEDHQKELVASERAKATARMARDVAHNIGSSLTTLEANTPKLAGVPEGVRSAIRKATSEIRARLQALQEQARTVEEADTQRQTAATAPTRRPKPTVVQQLASVVEDVVADRRGALPTADRIEIEAETGERAYGAFAKVDVVEFRAILTNLINNAVEAIPTKGTVTVRVEHDAVHCVITVADTGKGIAPELLPKLAQRGVTHGKANGSGLGLSHARVTLEEWGGSLQIDSALGRGTTVRVTLPQAPPPAWHLPALQVGSASTVCILDDDGSIHALWDGRFSDVGLPTGDASIKHFQDGDSFSAWVTANSAAVSRTLFLVDYELMGDRRNGLDLIEALGIEHRAVLVTGRSDEPAVVSRAKFLGVKVLPKPLAGAVPIELAARVPGTERGSRMSEPATEGPVGHG